MPHPTRPAHTRTPAPSAAIARVRLQHVLAADRHGTAILQAPADALLSRLLCEAPAEDGRAA